MVFSDGFGARRRTDAGSDYPQLEPTVPTPPPTCDAAAVSAGTQCDGSADSDAPPGASPFSARDFFGTTARRVNSRLIPASGWRSHHGLPAADGGGCAARVRATGSSYPPSCLAESGSPLGSGPGRYGFAHSLPVTDGSYQAACRRGRPLS